MRRTLLRNEAFEHASKKFHDLDNHYLFEVWHPSLLKIRPNGLSWKLALWWAIYFSKLLSNRFGFCLFIMYQKYNRNIVHYTLVSSKSFKFPFMKENDIHIGPIWTDPNHRGEGIASYVVEKIFELYKTKERVFWLMINDRNPASKKIAKNYGFIECGKVEKKTLGIYKYVKNNRSAKRYINVFK